MASLTSKLMTAEGFYDWSQRWENRDRNFELEAGVFVQLPMTGERKGFVCANVAAILGNYVRARRRGHVCANNVGLIVERNPDTVLGPDIAVFLERRRFQKLERGYLTRMPRLAIDVLPEDQRQGKLQKRASRLLRSGVGAVWQIDCEDRSVIVHLPGRFPMVVENHEELTGRGVLPVFRCKVADFFAMAGE